MKTNKLTKDVTHGFTLIELLVVIAIIGILGAIIYAPFQSARRKGRDAARVIEMKNLVSSITLYADSHNGYFPCDLNILKASQGDALPSNSNLTATPDNSKYNYTGYGKSGDTDATNNPSGTCAGAAAGQRVSGFHLWTHLETANGALAGASKCVYIYSGTGNISDYCINFGSVAGVTTNVPETANPSSQAKFLLSERVPAATTGDADNVCATNNIYCILDYHQ